MNSDTKDRETDTLGRVFAGLVIAGWVAAGIAEMGWWILLFPAAALAAWIFLRGVGAALAVIGAILRGE